ncbi:AraC family transcriptional regulator [Saccharopolyspora sp. WRP15-2]|uniref:AraC family transcriptional regulator n=1 Tax=Saccharopolyspora oryzae TaxID=2997343 RepID=A0ABT4UQ07_9PSEU|nr:AraC family transcriptional regulator [Saccharopolyspora oryzae]MDA3623798.1 AraC family transcriptional regulator [Saccharopolyspora oryzae]
MSPVADAEPARPHVIASGFDDWDFPRTTAGLVLLLDFAATRGMSAVACLAGSGIDPDTLHDPDLLVEASQELAVVRNILREVGSPPGLGLEVGSHYHLTTFGIYGYALISSPTVRDMVEVGLRYAALTFAFSRITGEVDELGRFVLRMRGHRIPADVRRFLVERDCAAIVVMHQHMFEGSDPIPLRQVDFGFPEPSGGLPFPDYGVPVRYGAPTTALYLDGDYLDRPMPHGNPHTAQVCRRLCDRLLAQRSAGGVAKAVREYLIENGGVGPGVEHLARRLHMSSRTLRRKLSAEGTTYRRLIDDVRLTIVQDTMRRETLSAAELAQRFGYAEGSSFVRAFRRWTGETAQ